MMCRSTTTTTTRKVNTTGRRGQSSASRIQGVQPETVATVLPQQPGPMTLQDPPVFFSRHQNWEKCKHRRKGTHIHIRTHHACDTELELRWNQHWNLPWKSSLLESAQEFIHEVTSKSWSPTLCSLVARVAARDAHHRRSDASARSSSKTLALTPAPDAHPRCTRPVAIACDRFVCAGLTRSDAV